MWLTLKFNQPLNNVFPPTPTAAVEISGAYLYNPIYISRQIAACIILFRYINSATGKDYTVYCTKYRIVYDKIIAKICKLLRCCFFTSHLRL